MLKNNKSKNDNNTSFYIWTVHKKFATHTKISQQKFPDLDEIIVLWIESFGIIYNANKSLPLLLELGTPQTSQRWENFSSFC